MILNFYFQRYLRRRKSNYESSESKSSESEVETDTETEKEKEVGKETGENSVTVIKNVTARIGKAHKGKSTIKESRYTTDRQEETVKAKHNTKAERDKIKYKLEDKHVVGMSKKGETRKTTEGDMMKTLGTNRENSMKMEKTAEQLKVPKETKNELESTTKMRLEKNIIRPKKDLDNKDKKHLTTKRYHYDRNRESETEPRQPKDKVTIKHEMKNKEKKKTHKPKNEHTTINSYTSKKEEMKAKTRHPEEYRFLFFFSYIFQTSTMQGWVPVERCDG